MDSSEDFPRMAKFSRQSRWFAWKGMAGKDNRQADCASEWANDKENLRTT
jgi:hypothetical protein